MGNWRDRPRRFRRPKNPPAPKDYAPELLELWWRDGIPLWEKKFCVGVGSVPWRKIVDTKKLMFFHSNVLNWDDSAAEEAFHSAKRRYWAEINGADCGISLPDHDMYTDEIDWNPTIDSELIEDLDLARYAPGEEESHDKFESENNNGTSVSVPSEEHSRNADNPENPWECGIKQGSTLLKNNVEGWNTCWNDKVTDGNPWEQDFKGSGRIKNNSWGDCLKSGNKLNNRHSPGSHVNHSDNHVVSVKDEVWGDSRNNMGGQSSSHSYSQNKRNPKEREWLCSEEHSCGRKHRKDEELRRREGWGASKNGYPMREFSYQNEYNYRQQRDDYQTAQCWRRGFPRKHSILPLSTGDRYV